MFLLRKDRTVALSLEKVLNSPLVLGRYSPVLTIGRLLKTNCCHTA